MNNILATENQLERQNEQKKSFLAYVCLQMV